MRNIAAPFGIGYDFEKNRFRYDENGKQYHRDKKDEFKVRSIRPDDGTIPVSLPTMMVIRQYHRTLIRDDAQQRLYGSTRPPEHSGPIS